MDAVKGLGRVVFAAIFLLIGGLLNVVWGIAAIANSHVSVANTHYVFSDLKTWGWVMLILGALEVLASLWLLPGNTFGRWFGIIAGALVAFVFLLDVPAYPFWWIGIFCAQPLDHSRPRGLPRESAGMSMRQTRRYVA